jgi:hypothetical protein
VVERLPVERERERVSLNKRRVDARPLEVSACEFELLLLDVNAEKSDVRELLAEDRQDGADSAANLEQARSAPQLSAVADQPLSPVLRLLDEPLLLARAVAMNVPGYRPRVGSTLQSASRPAATASAAGPMSFGSS